MENSDSTLTEGYLESFDPELRRAFDLAKDNVDPKLVDYGKVKIRKDSILLSGDATFYTLQGEGPTTGLPCVFCRLHVCNLKCDWCDAFYTWNPNSPEFWTEGKRTSFEGCANLIRASWQECKNLRIQPRVVWTGGEPLIQKKQIDEVMGFLYPVETMPWMMEIETNGTLMPTQFQLETAQFNCSPKLGNSGNKDHVMFKPKILKELNKANTTFKFVCMTEADLREIELSYLQWIDENKIIIMPQGILEEEVSMNAKVLAEPCKKRGWRLMGRWQNVLWDGARRGV